MAKYTVTKKNPSGADIFMGCTLLTGVIALFFFGIPFLAMLAWNAFVPTALGGPTIDYWTAFAGVFLLNIIGGAFRSLSSRD